MSDQATSPLIIGHRGASAVAPENTLAAFVRAIDDRADGIELDVRLARDGAPVVIHDASLHRTGGLKATVAGLSSGRLGHVDVGSWFNRRHPEVARLNYTRQTVPTLDEVFELLINQGHRAFVAYVEMKTGRTRSLNIQLGRAVVEVIRRHQLQSRTIVIGFNLTLVRHVKEIDNSIRTGALFGPRQRATRSTRRIIDAAVDCRADEILLHRMIATPAMIDCALARKLAPVVWTVNDLTWIGRAQERGIHALVTNNPANMRER